MQQENETEWWARWNELKAYVQEQKQKQQQQPDSPLYCWSRCSSSSVLVHIPRQTRLGLWLDRQRAVYHRTSGSSSESKCQIDTTTDKDTAYDTDIILSEQRRVALASLDLDWWMTRRQWQWKQRYRELQAYADAHGGDCRVPISYAANPALAHWVSTQRKHYNQRKLGKASSLTDERFQHLEALGFVWSARDSWTANDGGRKCY